MSKAADAAATPLISRGAGPLRGRCRVPGDKSISHRALILGSLAVGRTRVKGLLEGEDVLCTARAMAALGASLEPQGEGDWLIKGVGVGGLGAPGDVLDMGNSGTGARLLMGAVATHPFTSFFTGDASLRRRPMARVTVPLSEIGARFVASEGGRLPLAVLGAESPLPITYRLPVASAQVKSAVLLAGLNTPGETIVEEPLPSRDHSERLLRHFGASVLVEALDDGGRRIRLKGQPELLGADLMVPGDPSSAAFIAVAALLVPGSEVTICGVGLNPLRAGLYDTLAAMGADITLADERIEGGEPVADLVVRASALTGVEVPAERAPSMIDEYPILAVAAAFASGRTVMRGLAELRVKESDRLAAIAEGILACGGSVAIEGDTLVVEGRRPAGGGAIAAKLDHRIAMAFLVLGMAAQKPVMIDDGATIATSFPGFAGLMNGLGAAISEGDAVIIAVDGPAASGKGTLARRLAAHFGLAYLDTGMLYRAAGLKALAAGDPRDPAVAAAAAASVTLADLDDPRLRDEATGEAASVVAAIPAVRQALLSLQRAVAHRPPGAVLDGRDIGTVVCPEADAKLFLTAALDARATRRFKELQGGDSGVIYGRVLEDMKARDARDSGRAAAPLKRADDALELDTTALDAEAAFAAAVSFVAKRLGGR